MDVGPKRDLVGMTDRSGYFENHSRRFHYR